jgi:hypothetical protein
LVRTFGFVVASRLERLDSKPNAVHTQLKGMFGRHTAPARSRRPEAARRTSRILRHPWFAPSPRADLVPRDPAW